MFWFTKTRSLGGVASFMEWTLNYCSNQQSDELVSSNIGGQDVRSHAHWIRTEVNFIWFIDVRHQLPVPSPAQGVMNYLVITTIHCPGPPCSRTCCQQHPVWCGVVTVQHPVCFVSAVLPPCHVLLSIIWLLPLQSCNCIQYIHKYIYTRRRAASLRASNKPSRSLRHHANQPTRLLRPLHQHPNFMSTYLGLM